MLQYLDEITDIFSQVTAYSKISLGGYHHLTLGRITILLAIHAIAGLPVRRGSLKETHSQNGKRLKPLVPPCGFMGNVR
jgi:hypothetical protein